ncbi:MAG: hypothetical protein IK014_12205 [Lachnospiraceae bacterium]|jgi:asparagine synthase (glutamine-hydrolysing)|nr:hypothetical protein [Lachnospiraceae bacterium]
MSAIWGVVDFNGKAIGNDIKEKMKESFSECKIDKVQDIHKDNYYLATGIQNIVEEAQLEQFPYTYIDGKVMVADAIIDNRTEMLTEFKLKNELSLKEIDGSILYESVAGNLRQSLEKLCGAFAFVEYDENEKTIYVANDVVGTRSIYYSFCNGRFVFSSLIKTILPFMPTVEVEEKWLSQFIDNDNLLIVDSPSATPYKEIYRLEPGELLIIKKAGVEHIAYWDPRKKVKNLKLKTDEEYKALVLDTFKKCVESVIRTPGEIGILLSGGLDSNAVAAYAAPFLKKAGKRLLSYTSVPNDKIEPIPKRSYYVSNERIYIEKLREYHSNLEPHFIDVSKIDVMKDFEIVSEMIESPVKTVVNMSWIYELVKQAESDGCKILLGGQYGNITISYGFLYNLFATYKYSGRFIKLIKAVNTYGKKYKRNRKRVLKYALQIEKVHSLKKGRTKMYDKEALRQTGETEMHESLASGLIFRDPTRDRRLIELVLSLPIKCFVDAETDRRMVRVYMKDIIPDIICSDQFHRGSQGTSGFDQIRNDWETIKSDLIRKYGLASGKKYLSKMNLCEWIEKIDEKDKSNEFNLMKAIYLGYLCQYLEKMNSTEKK